MDMKKTKVALVTTSLLALLSGCNDNSSSLLPPRMTSGHRPGGCAVAAQPVRQPAPAELLTSPAPTNSLVGHRALVDTQTSAAKGLQSPAPVFAGQQLRTCGTTISCNSTSGKASTPAGMTNRARRRPQRTVWPGQIPAWVPPPLPCSAKMEGCILQLHRPARRSGEPDRQRRDR